jgi:perosamine synthetase
VDEIKNIPVFKPAISEAEIQSVVETLRSGWLGPGPRVAEFERLFAEAVEAPFAVATSSGTAALKTALSALNLEKGDEIILPSFTYISALRVILDLGAIPVFADIEPEQLTIDPRDVERRITSRTKVIVAVHHGGQLADIDSLSSIARSAGVVLIDDAAHAAGARYKGRPAGCLTALTCFSFSAVKNLACGDGGMVTTSDSDLAHRLTVYRSMGLDRDTWNRYGSSAESVPNRWAYNIVGSGERLHMNDILASLGIVQLARLSELNRSRKVLVDRYRAALNGLPGFRSISERPDTTPSWHMFTGLLSNRDRFVDRMREHGIAIGVHYHPLHLYPLFDKYRTELPVTESLWPQIVTFPLYPTMTAAEQDRVINATRLLLGAGD